MRLSIVAVLTALTVTAFGQAPAVADEPTTVTEQIRFTTSDGVSLQTTLTGAAPLEARPTVVEFSPYGRNSQTISPSADYNLLLVQIRGTGDSDGSFDALGPRNQADVPEVLRWACEQPWSDGSLALNGFSASAIIIYNSLHQELPCVKTAVLKSGTFELYRDLLVPGGVTNIVPGAGVIAMIGAPALIQGPDRLSRNPGSALDVLSGLFTSGLNAGLLHPTLDDFWKQRGFRGDVNHLPILMVNGIFDVESRGAFQAYQALKGDGAHLLLAGGHDGVPAGTDGGAAKIAAWLDHHLRGIDNGVTETPRVQLQMSDGDREDMLAGQFVQRNATDWPIPGTKWEALNLDGTRELTLGAPKKAATQTYVSVPTVPFSSDVPTTALLGAAGLNMLTTALPFLTETGLSGISGLTYTTPKLSQDVWSAGPASLEVRLSTTSPETAIWVVLSDVAPDGTAHPLTVGRLLSSFPNVDEGKSLRDASGTIVQPYGDFSRKTALAGVLVPKLYKVELWPVANRFKAGHRIRVDIVGASLFSLPTLPGVNSVKVGPGSGSRLLFPVLPESNLPAALAP